MVPIVTEGRTATQIMSLPFESIVRVSQLVKVYKIPKVNQPKQQCKTLKTNSKKRFRGHPFISKVY